MENKNTEIVNPAVTKDANLDTKAAEQAVVTPKPDLAEKTDAKVEADPEATKAKELEDRKKTNLAFIKMRKEVAALKRQQKLGVPAEVKPASEVNEAEIEARIRAKIKAEEAEKEYKESIAAKANEAMESLAADVDVASLPTGVVDILDMLDSDPRLARLNEIDPAIALNEAKKMWKAKHGIASTIVPKAHTPVSSVNSSVMDSKEALLKKLHTLDPQSNEFRDAYAKYKKLN